MGTKSDAYILKKISKYPILEYILKWTILSVIVGGLVGAASAFFLWSLHWATNWREAHVWIIAGLPIGGFIIGLSYHLWGKEVVKGNNQIIEEIDKPNKIIPFRMAPLVFFGTVATHFFGGSAGREGTAVQMGGAIADFFTKPFKLQQEDRRILLIMGVSAGFASVFGTPLAGAVFALEVMLLDSIKFKALIPSFLVAFISHYSCIAFPIHHTQYIVDFVPELSFTNVTWSIVAGICFGIAAMMFAVSTRFFSNTFSRFFSYPPLRPVVGGIVLAIVVWLMGSTDFIGLGVPMIVDSFSHEMLPYAFILKIALTAFTLGAGFKGGEVTPLFFIGATLGNVLIWFIPLPMALLAGMGFVGVFAGATNTPIACTVMGMELFGYEMGIYLAIGCFIAYLFSGIKGIYSSQIYGNPKKFFYKKYL